VLPLIALLAMPVAADAVYYRYKANDGTVVLGSSVPADFARNGYDVVNSRGRVVRSVAPALTEEQLAAKLRLEAEAAEARRLSQEQLEKDRALLQLYRTPDDATRARDRRLAELEGLIAFKTNHLAALQKDLKEFEGRAANIERLGRPIPQAVLIDIDRTLKAISSLETEVSHTERQIEAVNSEFAAIISRLDYLNSLQR